MTDVQLGLRANARQFSLLVLLNGFVGAMVGLERSVLPLVGEQEFGLDSQAAILSFVVAFGIAKALSNLAAGGLADRVGRKRLLVLGWLLALPVPLLIAIAPNWGFIVAANVFLGASQGFAWSMTVVMKIDLVGPRRRGLALGLNESAGYLGVALAAFATGALAATLRHAPSSGSAPSSSAPSDSRVGAASYGTPLHTSRSSSARTAGDGERWTLRYALPTARSRTRSCGPARRPDLSTTSTTRSPGALCRSTWPRTAPASPRSASSRPSTRPSGALGQLADRLALRPHRAQATDRRRDARPGRRARVAGCGRRRLPAGAARRDPARRRHRARLPDLDRCRLRRRPAVQRAPAVGVYRFWRDFGFVAGALISGIVADTLGAGEAIAVVAALTGASGIWVAATRWASEDPRLSAGSMADIGNHA